ncbi:MAG: hypothetical protein IJU87_02820 [Lachnospiraceae bacterium]|nr:hypothetical protein [Lachnospiraceae bacterium]
MFDTKKTARLVNWNSTQYNNANRAISSFQKIRDTVVKLMTGDEIPDPEKMKDAIKNLQSSYGECRTSLQEYCAKVLADPDSLEKKSTSAGIARAAGATGGPLRLQGLQHLFYLFFSQVLIMAQNGSILYPYFSIVTCVCAGDCYEKTFEGG